MGAELFRATKNLTHVRHMLGLLRSDAGLAAEAAAVTALETTLAQAELDRVARRDPAATDHQMRMDQLQALTPGFDWNPGKIAFLPRP